MNISSFPKEIIKLPDCENGWHVVILNGKSAVRLIEKADEWETKTPTDSALQFIRLKNGEKLYIDVNAILNKNNLFLPTMRMLKFSILFGKCENGIFKSDSAVLYKGVLAGGL